MTAVGLVSQFGAVVSGAYDTGVVVPVPLALRLWRFVSYFTIQSNLLVAHAVTLLRDPARNGRVWRVLRLGALLAITASGVVHWFLLRPLQDLTAWLYRKDKVVHVVVPLLAVIAGWPSARDRGSASG